MTETYAGPVTADEIVDSPPGETDRLQRAADALLAEGPGAAGARPLRRAVREDAAAVRDWGRDRAGRLRGAVQDEPVRATVYALAIGVVIGLLAAR